MNQSILRGDEDQFDGLQLFGHCDCDAVRVHAIGLAVAVEPERWNDRYDALREQRLEQLHVDALDLAGEEMVHALDDAHRMSGDRVRAGAAQVVGGETFQNLVGEPVGGGERELERRRIRDAGAVEVRGLDALLVGERLDLLRRTVDEHHADIQRPQHRQIEQQRGKVVVRDDGAVNRENEGLFAKLRNVLQDAPQVGQFHDRSRGTTGTAF